MKLLTQAQTAQLIQNGQANAESGGALDFPPVVKLFTPDAGCTWLLSEVDPEDADLAFGLCDLGLGYPELGYVRLSEIAGLRGKLGLPVERDLHFKAAYPLSVYAEAARRAECITYHAQALEQAQAALVSRKEVRS